MKALLALLVLLLAMPAGAGDLDPYWAVLEARREHRELRSELRAIRRGMPAPAATFRDAASRNACSVGLEQVPCDDPRVIEALCAVQVPPPGCR